MNKPKSTPDKKWVKSVKRLGHLRWKIEEFDRARGSSYFKLDQAQLTNSLGR